MKPVYQNQLGWGAGDCAWACVASIFELELADLGIEQIAPPCDADLRKWTECRFPNVRFCYEDICTDFDLVEADPSWGGDAFRWVYKVPSDFEPPPVEYWMASVFSLGLQPPPEYPYYPFPGLHAVVMRGKDLAHDPNPRYTNDMLYSPVLMKTWWEHA